MQSSSSGLRGRRLLLAALFLACAAYQVRHTAQTLSLVANREAHVATPFSLKGFTPVIERVGEEARRASVHEGDRVLSVNGRPLRGKGDLFRPLSRARPGDVLHVEIASSGDAERRGGDEKRGADAGRRGADIVLAQRHSQSLSGEEWIPLLFLDLITPWLCLLLGFSVAALRPGDLRAWLLLLLLVSFSQFGDRDFVAVSGWGAAAGTLAFGYSRLLGQLWPVGMLLFAVAFPDRLEIDRRYPWVKWLLLLPLTGLAVEVALSEALAVTDLAAAAAVGGLSGELGRLRIALLMAAIAGFFAVMGFRMGTATDPDDRRRLHLLMWGSQLSLTPLGVLVTYTAVSGQPFTSVPPWIVVSVLGMLVGFPLTLAHVIVVERALDVRVVVRQGLQYALARNGILAIQILLSAAIISIAAGLASNPGVNRPRIIMTVAVGVMLVFLTRNAAAALRGWTDRRFFREAYDAERILSDLGETVRTMVEMQPLLKTVTERISESLHVRRVAVLLKEDGVYASAQATDAPGSLPSFAADGALVTRMSTLQPLRVYGDEHQARVDREPALLSESSSLDALGAELLLPLAVKGELVGILALGPKQSEAPFSKSDLRLLSSVANQTALALENSRLTAAIASEVALRARMSREVEIAREVQERLFPQNHPDVPGLDYAGACRPALGVGGDYFDFLDLVDGRLGLAIGDVSGKGISAALLMASLQASLRGQSLGGASDLSILMRNVNQLIYEASQSNRYATFFYATFDPRSRLLRYVNAGHNAPMLLRDGPAGPCVERLDQGGPVIGMLFPVDYAEASVTLQPGDLLIAFTDGISEAMNFQEEEWGEDRLLAAASACDGLPASEIVSRLFSAADGFASGAKQHDDMTLVVARVTPLTG